MANAINQTEENVPSPTALNRPATELQTILAAITNIQSRPAPVAKPKTDMEQILSLLTPNTDNNGVQRNTNNDNTCKQPKVENPNLPYKFYC